MKLFPLVLVATVLGIMNTFNSIFESLFEPVVGAILDWTWDGAAINGMHQFSIKGYYMSLAILPISLFLALLTLSVIKETNCRVIEESMQ